MPILNYTTSISPERSISEITKCLVQHGATKIVTDYVDQEPSSVTFCITINNTLVAFSLPANYQGVLNSMEKDKKIPRKFLTREQAYINPDFEMTVIKKNLDVPAYFQPELWDQHD
jgi:hypothetical protein